MRTQNAITTDAVSACHLNLRDFKKGFQISQDCAAVSVPKRWRMLALLILSCVTLVTTARAAAPGSIVLRHSLFDPGTNGQPGTGQGYSVALDGNIAAVGLPFDRFSDEVDGRVKVYDATTGALLHTLNGPKLVCAEEFGTSMALAGLTLIVGTRGNPTNVYVYDLAGSTPTAPVLTVHPPLGQGWDFGEAVAISGTRVVVGDSGNGIAGAQAGAAFVFDLAGATPAVPILTLTNPTPAWLDRFGWAVAISGTRVVVGAFEDDTGATDAGTAYVYDLASATPTVPVVTLNDPRRTAGDRFGGAVAISGTRVVVGATGDDTGATDAGTAYVYDVGSATPTDPVWILNDPRHAGSDQFGWDVAISGTRVVVSAVNDDTGASDAGIAYVYDLAGASPSVPVATITNPSPASSDWFGFAVALSGARAVVGAPYDDTRASGAGSAYTYDLAGATPTVPVATLNVPTPASGDNFGSAVTISGSRLAVGVPNADSGARGGIIYLYDLAGATPAGPVVTLARPTLAAYAGFGSAVSMSGSRLVAGAPGDHTGGTNSGVAYVFDVASATPASPVLTLTNPTPAVGEQFGRALAVDGMRVVVGSHQDSIGTSVAGRAVGSAYVYDLDSTTPAVPVLTLTNPSPMSADLFGSAVAISGTRIVTGAPGDDTGAGDAGSAYVYDLAGATPAVPVLTLTNPSPAALERFGSSVAISGSRVVVGEKPYDTVGSVHVYDLAGAMPAVPVLTLTNPSPSLGDQFGWDVAISGTRVVIGADGTAVGNAGSVYVYDLAGATPAVPLVRLDNPTPAASDAFGFALAVEGVTVIAGAPNDDTNAKDRGAAYVFIVGPALKILPAVPGLATVSWTPTNSPDFVLQYSDGAAPANWLNVPGGGTGPVTVTATNNSRFYRVVSP